METAARSHSRAAGASSMTGFLERFRNGEPSALADVYRAHVSSVARMVASLLRRHAHKWPAIGQTMAAEVPDLVQESFVRAFEASAREHFDGVRDYGPYVMGIATNVVRGHLRSRRRSRDVPVDALPEESTLVPPNQENDFADAQTAAIVMRYLARLPPELRELHELIYVQGLSQREAASALGRGRQTVRTLDARLRNGLRAELAAASWTDAHSEQDG
jgi:RNA polymerase sigma factor (sigma-70 family)